MFVSLSAYLFICLLLLVCFSVDCLLICLSVCLSFYLSVCLFVCLFICLCVVVFVFVCVFVCVFVRLLECYFFQVSILVNEEKLKDEIQYIRKQYEVHRTTRLSDDCDLTVYFQSSRLELLLKWCQVICQQYGLKVGIYFVIN